MKTTFLCISLVLLAGFVSAGEPLSEMQLRRIIGLEHNDHFEIEALKIYPKGGSTLHYDMSNDGESIDTTFTLKTVKGQYVVWESQPNSLFTIVIEYDEANEAYQKYVLAFGKLSAFLVGKRMGYSRSVLWVPLMIKNGQPQYQKFLKETISDDSIIWKTLVYQEGEFKRSYETLAKVTGK